MAFRKRSPSRSRSSRPKPTYLWQTASVDAQTISGNTTVSINLLPNIVEEVRARASIARVIGNVAVRPRNSDTEHATHAGIYILSEEAFTAGNTFEMELDLARYHWLQSWYQYQGNILDNPQQYEQRMVDIHPNVPMRTPENRFILGFENVVAAATEFAFFLRILLKLR